MNRRDFFIRGGALAGAAALNAFPYHLYANAAKKSASDRVQLGPMKVSVSRLAMGTGTNGVGGSSNQTRKLGLGGLADMFRAGYDQGITFWDSADQYGSHPHVTEALKRVPREKVAILTKTHASTEKEMRADLDRFRKELGTDYLDIVLLHCMVDAQWHERNQGAMDVPGTGAREGHRHAHGVSCHTIQALRTAARSPGSRCIWRASIRPASPWTPTRTVLGVLSEMKAAGKGVIGMKILGAGRLRNAGRMPAVRPRAGCCRLLHHRRREPRGTRRPRPEDPRRERSRVNGAAPRHAVPKSGFPMKLRNPILLIAFAVSLAAQPQPAQEPAQAAQPTPKPAEAPKPKDETSITRHSVRIGGQEIRYTATAGTLVLKKEDGTPRASIFYIAYTKDGVADLSKRPVTFAFNGGPGSSSVWLHLGALGPSAS